MNYDEMPAGPEMDRLVPERVMGWLPLARISTYPGGWAWSAGRGNYSRPIGEHGAETFSPSTNIAHAWEVVEKVAAPERRLVLFQNRKGQWVAAFAYDGPDYGDHWIDNSISYVSEADAAPLAICRAALKAVGG